MPNNAGRLTHVLYETGLGREVELPALAFWKGAYEVLTPLQIAASIASSTEFTAYHAGQNNDAFVESLYQAGLGRPAEASGLASWTSLLSSGSATRADVLLAVATSSEAHAHLTYNLSGAPNS